MQLIEKYIYAVTSRLPKDKREDIEKELRSIIEDMMDSCGGRSEENAKKVIEELGDPKKFAEKYNDAPRYLISPRVFDTYVLVLKIVLAAVCFGILVSTVVESVTTPGLGAGEIVGGFFFNIIGGLVTAFAWVTLVFFVIDRYNFKMDLKMEKEWTIADLKEIPSTKAVISKGECIASIVFSSIFVVLFTTVPWIFAAYVPGGAGIEVIPVFDIGVLNARIALVFGIYALSILKDIAKMLAGRWSLKLGIFCAVLSVLTLCLFLGLFMDMAIWNPAFGSGVVALVGADAAVFESVWNIIIYAVVWILVAIYIVTAITEIVKGIKHNS